MKLKSLINTLESPGDLRLDILTDDKKHRFFEGYFFNKADVKNVPEWKEIKHDRVERIEAGTSEKHGARLVVFIHHEEVIA